MSDEKILAADQREIADRVGLAGDKGSEVEPAPVRKLINPHLFVPKAKRWNDPRFAGGKVYFPIIGRMTRIAFRRASEAEGYARRVHERWCRMYDAAILRLAAEQ